MNNLIEKEITQGAVPIGVPKAYKYDAALVETAKSVVEEGLDIATNGLANKVVHNTVYKIDKPLDEFGAVDNGVDGQILRTKGDGTTEWVTNGTPTDEQVHEVVTEWLDEHPEATTTVIDGSLTREKFTSALQIGTGIVYQNLNQMVSDTSLNVGFTAFTKGYYAVNDGGSAFYYIREKTQSDVDNGGSIIFLNNGNVAERIGEDIIPDQFPGANDAEKLQNAIDYAIAKKSSKIIINRKFDITGHTLNINKRLSNLDDSHRQKLTFLGTGTGEIYKGDSGYIFSGTISHSSSYQYAAGDITFMNITFKGRTTPLNTGDLNRSTLCSVFDCSKLIRITCISNTYTSVGVVFDGKDCNSADESDEDPTSNAQQLYSYGDMCAYSHAYITVMKLWCCTFSSATIENCNYGALGLQDETNGTTINELHFVECCIENCPYGAVVLEDGTNKSLYNCTSLQIKGCYFENNGHSNDYDADIVLQYRFAYGNVIKDNHFAVTSEARACALWIRNKYWTLDGNSSTEGKVLFYVTAVDDAQVPSSSYQIVAKGNNVIGNDLTNNKNCIIGEYSIAYNQWADIPINATSSLAPGSYYCSTDGDITNAPNGLAGTLINLPGNNSILQMFIDKNNFKWSRSYMVNEGWTNWNPIIGAYSFEVQNLKDMDTITLPITPSVKSAVTFDLRLNTGVNVATFVAAQIVAAGSNTVAFRPKKYDGSTATGTDYYAIVTVTPLVE